jgi:hypothetical protein
MDLVKAYVGVDCFVGLAGDVEVILDLLRRKMSSWFGRRPTNTRICSLGEPFGLECIVGTKNLRRSIGGWKHDNVHLRHCQVGGVTTTSTHGV